MKKKEISEELEALQISYELLFEKKAPSRYKNNEEWLKGKIDAKSKELAEAIAKEPEEDEKPKPPTEQEIALFEMKQKKSPVSGEGMQEVIDSKSAYKIWRYVRDNGVTGNELKTLKSAFDGSPDAEDYRPLWAKL